ncbi:hypothetical protein EVAR_34167_1 [Eumeta japonica]|uniref:Uncharacterized protein n=1 Tax=Eumeta variegata TaxID=151549 RepID=A0A4C1WK15_EUMVA|nr:hypothetical protein EVAR_34167_1 [Eumeta japonica]
MVPIWMKLGANASIKIKYRPYYSDSADFYERNYTEAGGKGEPEQSQHQPQQQHQIQSQQQHQQQPQQQHQHQPQQHQPQQQQQPQQQHQSQQQPQELQQPQQQHQPQQQQPPQKQQESLVESKATENSSTMNEEMTEEPYDNQGNYIGDQQRTKAILSISLEYESDRSFRDDYREQDSYDSYNQRERGDRGGSRSRPTQRGRGKPQRGRGGGGGFRERSPIRRGDWPDRSPYDRYTQPMPDYPRALPVPERNDCEIIVVSKALTQMSLIKFVEHRNMPVEEALALLSRNFAEVQRGGSTGREAVYALLGQLADGRTLTALQYDKVIDYLKERREQQVKIELGEPLATSTNNKTQVDLQQRILSILNDKKIESTPTPVPAPVPAPVAVPVPATVPISTPTPVADTKNKLLNDPTVRKALDSILQKFI